MKFYLAPSLRVHNDKRFAVTFVVVIAVIALLVVLLRGTHPDFRNNPIDFGNLKSSELVVTYGLSRSGEAGLKLGYAQTHEPPELGLFGNHQFMFFGKDAFPSQNISFFNYWYANLGLPDILDYLTYLEKRGKLPKRAILVQVTTPNNDNGLHILDRSEELPVDIQFISEDRGGVPFATRVRYAYEEAIFVLTSTFNYSTVVFGLINIAQGPGVSRIVDKEVCAQLQAVQAKSGDGLLNRLAQKAPAGRGTIKLFANALAGVPIYCDEVVWHTAYRPDGSQDSGYFQQPPQLDENKLDPMHSSLHWDDLVKLKAVMQAIHDLGKRNNLKVGFIIPPVYESDRTSTVDAVFNQAMQGLPEVTFIDHRKERGNPQYFAQYDHPAPTYFRFLVRDLIANGFVAP